MINDVKILLLSLYALIGNLSNYASLDTLIT